MSKNKFFTKFEKVEKKLHKYDRHDNVDRLTFVDTTMLINEFMNAGKVLQMNQSAALYGCSEEALKDNTNFSTPVYDEDLVIKQAKIEAASKALNAELTNLGSASGSDDSKHSDEKVDPEVKNKEAKPIE